MMFLCVLIWHTCFLLSFFFMYQLKLILLIILLHLYDRRSMLKLIMLLCLNNKDRQKNLLSNNKSCLRHPCPMAFLNHLLIVKWA
jgi:hypothetical protein